MLALAKETLGLSDPQNVDKTAEEIRSSKQRSYTTVKDLQRALGTAITELVYAVSKLLDAQWSGGEAATGYGTGAGLCGWNCRHTFFAVFPELGEPPAWTQEQLKALNARDIEYNGKLYTQYEISQMQRARERNVRRWKKRYLAEDAAGVDTTNSAIHLRAGRQSLKEFAQATGGRVDSARTSVPKFGRSEGSKAAWANKKKEETMEQFYRPVTRGNPETFVFRSNQTVSVKRVDSYTDEVYVSDRASIKPRALHIIKQNTDKALKQWGVSQKPAIVILSEEEAGNALGKYDPIKNVVYYTPRINDPNIAVTAGGKGAVEFHEMWHAKQADRFRKKGWTITSENYGDYLHALCDMCKKNIDAVKITEYNVGEISDYAKNQFLLGRFDEVEAEYMTQRRRSRNGST